MLKVKCIQKFRDKNNIIIGYRIIDQNGNTEDVSSEYLKQLIQQGRLEVINITLTLDNRLIEKPIKQSHQKIIDIDKILLRLKLLGYISETEINKGCDHKIYLFKISEEDYRLIIPDDVTEIKYDYTDYATPISRISIESSNAKLTVYGGNNLKIVKGLFKGTKFSIIDLRKFNTSNVTDMAWMFHDCTATSIDLSSFDTSKVTNMNRMFCRCEATSLDLSSFDTSKVTDMGFMFCDCNATSLDLSSFNTSKVIDMQCMFCRCKATSIDLSSFDTSEVIDMFGMFGDCKANSLDLSSFNTSKVTYMECMFIRCKSTYINFGRNKDLKSAWNNRITGDD